MLSRLGLILTKAIRMVNSSKFLLLFDLTHPMHPIGSWTQTAKAHITNDPSIFFIFFIPNHVKEYLAFLMPRQLHV